MEIAQDVSLEDIAGEQNHYVSHLAEVNKSNDVIVTEDVRNKNGILLVRKGARISQDVAQKILQHKLIKPLEEQVQLENTLSNSNLHHDFKSLADKYHDVQQIQAIPEYYDTFKNLLEAQNLDPILMQKLTVLKDRLIEEYDKSLFCAWLSVLIAKELKLQEDSIEVAFIAGLTHDIGLLHISPDIVQKKQALTTAEWRAIQSHVVVGQLLLKNIKNLDHRAANAVLEHHERCDGSGYPAGKAEESLDIMGQVVGMADSMQAIRVNQFIKTGRNLRDAMPYLHMNASTHFLKVYRAMCSILHKSDLQPSRVNPFETFNALLDHLLIRGKKLQNAVVLLQQALELTGYTKGSNAYNKLIKVIEPVVIMIKTSGLVKEEIINWLELLQQQPDDTALDEMMEMELMQNELYWQLRKVCKAINEYVEKEARAIAPEHRGQLSRIATDIDSFLTI